MIKVFILWKIKDYIYWVLIKRIPNDYILDGFAFIQKCHIESYKRTEEDRFKEKILIAKGIMDIPVPEFSISNRLDLLNRLNALQCVVEIQTDLESSFFIGKLEEVKTFFVNCELEILFLLT